MNPRISCLLPAYNAQSTLSSSVESVRAQTFEDWELLLINDGSTDETAAIMDEVAKADPRIRVYHRPRGGIVAALNFGLERARGAVIARQDADDLSDSRRFEAQWRALDEREDVQLASCLVEHRAIQSEWGNAETETRGYSSYCDWLNSIVTHEEIRRACFIESPLAHPTVMFRRDLISLFGGYADGAFPEDYELWLRWLDSGVRMMKVPETLYTWNDSPGRLSRIDPRYSADAFLKLKASSLARWLKMKSKTELNVWGAGTLSRKRVQFLREEGFTVHAFIDVDPKRRGQTIGGAPVFLLDQFEELGSEFIVSFVGNRGAGQKIREFLVQKGREEEADFLICS